MRKRGCVESARAIEMRCRCPPENWCGYFAPSTAARPTCASSWATREATSARGHCRRLREDRLRDDVLHSPAGVEARVRILEDHLHAAPCRALRRPVDRTVTCHDGAVEFDRAARRRIQPDDEPRDRRFAAARFAHQAERFAGGDREADAVDGFQQRPRLALEDAIEPRRRNVEGPRDVPQLQQRFRHCFGPPPPSRRRGWRRRGGAPDARHGSARSRACIADGMRSRRARRRAAA